MMSFSCNHSLDGSFPPSPVEDRGSKRLSWGRLLHRLAELKGVNPRDPSDHCCGSESASLAGLSLWDSDSSLLCDPPEETVASGVGATIAQSLRGASGALGCSELVVPERLVHSVRQKLLQLATCEPCGLRGALVDICVDRGDRGPPCVVDRIAVDAALVPTFHVTLVLRLESGGLWPKVQRLFKGGRGSAPAPPGHRNTLRLCKGFRAVKQKLYSSGELLVEECC